MKIMNKAYKKIKYGAFLCMIALSAVSCEKESPLYSGMDYIYFTNEVKDSIYYNFGYHRSPQEDRIGIEVKITGMLSELDREYTVEVAENTQLTEGVDFEIEKSSLKIRANQNFDTLWVKVKNNQSLLTDTKLICLNLVDNENFNLIFENKTNTKIYVSDELKRPIWWDEWQDNEGLGRFSEIKYREFIKITGVYDLSEEKVSFENKRNYVLQFKYYLNDMRDAGKPVMDGDEEMRVEIYG